MSKTTSSGNNIWEVEYKPIQLQKSTHATLQSEYYKCDEGGDAIE
jgi:hypothetical protein